MIEATQIIHAARSTLAMLPGLIGCAIFACLRRKYRLQRHYHERM